MWPTGNENLEAMIKTIVNEFHWTPLTVSNLYCDNKDHLGIVWWYNVCRDLHKERNKK